MQKLNCTRIEVKAFKIYQIKEKQLSGKIKTNKWDVIGQRNRFLCLCH